MILNQLNLSKEMSARFPCVQVYSCITDTDSFTSVYKAELTLAAALPTAACQ